MVSNIFHFQPYLGNDPLWRSYLSDGLKPPAETTSLPVKESSLMPESHTKFAACLDVKIRDFCWRDLSNWIWDDDWPNLIQFRDIYCWDATNKFLTSSVFCQQKAKPRKTHKAFFKGRDVSRTVSYHHVWIYHVSCCCHGLCGQLEKKCYLTGCCHSLRSFWATLVSTFPFIWMREGRNMIRQMLDTWDILL